MANSYVSSQSNASAALSSAVDDVLPSSTSDCVVTLAEGDPWFAIDMGAEYTVQRVFLYKAERGRTMIQVGLFTKQ